MGKISFNKLFKTPGSPRPAEPKTTPDKESPASRPQGFMGALGGLRRRPVKVHPEPARADSPTMSRPQTATPTMSGRPPSVHSGPPRRPPPTLPPRQASPGRRMDAPVAAQRPQTPPQAAKPQRPVHAPVAKPQSPVHAQAAKPQRPVQAPAPVAKRDEVAELHVMLAELEELMAKSNKENYRLQVAVSMAETDEEEDAAQAALDAFKPGRAELIAVRKDVQARLAFVNNPKAHESVQRLMQLGNARGPLRSGGQRDIIVGNRDALRRDGVLLERRDELLAAQAEVRKSLANGAFDGLPKNDLRDMRALAALDVDAKLGEINELKATVRETNKQLEAMGAGGLFGGISTTPQERARMKEKREQDDQDALDNGYLN
jgi:hypothetical protein